MYFATLNPKIKMPMKKPFVYLSSVVLNPSRSQACSTDMDAGFLLISSCHVCKQARRNWT